jgi:hypothetical protein
LVLFVREASGVRSNGVSGKLLKLLFEFNFVKCNQQVNSKQFFFTVPLDGYFQILNISFFRRPGCSDGELGKM